MTSMLVLQGAAVMRPGFFKHETKEFPAQEDALTLRSQVPDQVVAGNDMQGSFSARLSRYVSRTTDGSSSLCRAYSGCTTLQGM